MTSPCDAITEGYYRSVFLKLKLMLSNYDGIVLNNLKGASGSITSIFKFSQMP